jgi:hypothetical protein
MANALRVGEHLLTRLDATVESAVAGNGRPERAQTQTLQPHMTVSQA